MDFLNFNMSTINADMEMANLYTIQELVKEEIKRRKNLEDEDFRKKIVSILENILWEKIQLLK